MHSSYCGMQFVFACKAQTVEMLGIQMFKN